MYHDDVAINCESGLNRQYDIGLVSPIWLQYIERDVVYLCKSCKRAVRVDSGMLASSRSFSNRKCDLNKEYSKKQKQIVLVKLIDTNKLN